MTNSCVDMSDNNPVIHTNTTGCPRWKFW